MPCQSDYPERSGQELESQRVCLLILYLFGKLQKEVPEWIKDASLAYCGNLDRLDEATKILCESCRSLTESEVEQYIYDAHSEGSRLLASWWERHQEWDARRVKEEESTRKAIIDKERALKKLTVSEIEALGIT